MNRNSSGMSTGAAVLCTLGIMVFIGWIIGLSEPKCAKSGCNNETKSGSNYCWLHDNSYHSYGSDYKRSNSKSSSSSTGSYSGSTGSSSSNGTSKSSGSTGQKSGTSSNSGKKYTVDSYDAVYDDGDYDYDRYYQDDDYARGVDDALDDWDEFGEDW